MQCRSRHGYIPVFDVSMIPAIAENDPAGHGRHLDAALAPKVPKKPYHLDAKLISIQSKVQIKDPDLKSREGTENS